jgi:hypothetical protein
LVFETEKKGKDERKEEGGMEKGREGRKEERKDERKLLCKWEEVQSFTEVKTIIHTRYDWFQTNQTLTISSTHLCFIKI